VSVTPCAIAYVSTMLRNAIPLMCVVCNDQGSQKIELESSSQGGSGIMNKLVQVFKVIEVLNQCDAVVQLGGSYISAKSLRVDDRSVFNEK